MAPESYFGLLNVVLNSRLDIALIEGMINQCRPHDDSLRTGGLGNDDMR